MTIVYLARYLAAVAWSYRIREQPFIDGLVR